jgi:hypothetical protein
MSSRAAESRACGLEIVRNTAHFADHACSGSSFAGDVSPVVCVVRNENAFFDRSPNAIN